MKAKKNVDSSNHEAFSLVHLISVNNSGLIIFILIEKNKWKNAKYTKLLLTFVLRYAKIKVKI